MKSVSFRSCVRAKLRLLGCDATAWLQSLGLSHLTEIIWKASDGVPPPLPPPPLTDPTPSSPFSLVHACFMFSGYVFFGAAAPNWCKGCCRGCCWGCCDGCWCVDLPSWGGLVGEDFVIYGDGGVLVDEDFVIYGAGWGLVDKDFVIYRAGGWLVDEEFVIYGVGGRFPARFSVRVIPITVCCNAQHLLYAL